MKSTITVEELKRIYKAHGAVCSDSELEETAEQCNAQADEKYLDIWGQALPSRSATEWGNHFALQAAHYQHCDAAETNRFHLNAYGE